MKTKTICIFSFAELSDKAKEKAMQYMRDNWQLGEECVGEGMDTIKKGLDEFNAQLNRSYSIDFTENYRSEYKIEGHTDLELTGLRLRTYILNHFYDSLFERKHYGEYKKRENGKYAYDRYSKISFVESSCPFTGMGYDEDFLDPIRAFVKNPTNDTLNELLSNAVENVISTVGKEIEYRNSEEAIAEMCEANEYEWDGNGKII